MIIVKNKINAETYDIVKQKIALMVEFIYWCLNWDNVYFFYDDVGLFSGFLYRKRD